MNRGISKRAANHLHCVAGRRSHAGFTLLELMITLVVMAIIIGAALPSFLNFFRDERQVSQINKLVFALDYARSEALKRDTPMCACATSTGASCAATTSKDWSPGFMVFVGTVCSTAPASTAILQKYTGVPSEMALTSTIAGAVQFQANGMLASGSSAMTFKLCDPRGASSARSADVTLSGRVTASSTVGKTASGTALTCP